MLRSRSMRAALRLAVLLASSFAPTLAPSVVLAQRASEPDSTRVLARSAFPSLRWRNIGPFRGGRSVAVAGSYVDSRVFYFGSVNGGVWKTTNGGQNWSNISDFRVKSNAPSISSVGAIAVAPSDPNVIWVGTGESKLREDLTYGNGIYRSTDGGESWAHLGLDDSQQIGAVRVHPTNPDIAWVAALGHAFGPNRMRGVYRTIDGGKSWTQQLFVDDSTGATDLALDPTNPRVLYAAMWRMQRFPWGMRSGGGRSGLWKSSDGGESWADISANPGLPTTSLGKIGIAVSPANPRRLYATVEAPDSAGTPRGGIFRSDDAGATWTRTDGDQKWQVRAWYYSTLTADPRDENTVYVNNLGTWRSVDGGRTWTRIRVPHGDTHQLWIDPKDSQRMIHANDGGATVSFDRGATWSSIMNQPTSQFYHVITDNQFPYRVYGAQQDNTTVSIASRSDEGAITRQDWHVAAGGESAYIAIDPTDPNITYGGGYMGEIWRQDLRTKHQRNVAVWLDNYDGWAAADVPYRFAWTFPLFFSPHDPKTLYAAAQYLFRSTNEGNSWTKISPDLSRADPRTLGRSGGVIHGDMTGTEWYAMAFAVAESPLVKGLIWAGSDDGLVHVTRDGGASWQNVTPPGLGAFTKMSIVEPSHHDAGTVYIAANRYQQDDFKPYLLKTSDYGRTWSRIDAGIPAGAYTRVIREDPVRRGLLFAGTETGVYVSFDDGARWQPLQMNLPRVSIRDLAIKNEDLVAATHGRSFWILDDISPLRQISDSVRSARVHLFAPATAVRFEAGRSSRRDAESGENPQAGVYVDYWLSRRPRNAGEVKLEFLGASGEVFRTFTSPDSSESKRDSLAVAFTASDSLARLTAYDTTGQSSQRRRIEGDSASYMPADSVVHARVGLNRFVWDLRAPGVRPIKNVVNDEGTYDGPMIVPGEYTVRLTADGTTRTQRFRVIDDPRSRATPVELAATWTYNSQVVAKINQLADQVRRIEAMQKQIADRESQAKGQPYASRISAAGGSLKARLEAIRAELADVHSQADQITLHYPVKLYNQLLNVNRMGQSFDRAPTEQSHAVFRDLSTKVDAQLDRLRALESGDLTAFNAMMRELNVPAVTVEVVKPIA
ncbi:MAG: glycosyl hydrolase [Gemmatimonadaceae bacterium]